MLAVGTDVVDACRRVRLRRQTVEELCVQVHIGWENGRLVQTVRFNARLRAEETRRKKEREEKEEDEGGRAGLHGRSEGG